MASINISEKTFFGSNLLTKHSGIYFHFKGISQVDPGLLSQNKIDNLKSVLPSINWQTFDKHYDNQGLLNFLGALTLCLQEIQHPQHLAFTIHSNESISFEFWHVEATRSAINLAFSLLFRLVNNQSLHDETFKKQVEHGLMIQKALQPDLTSGYLLKSARSEGIPYYSILPGACLFQYGQGHKGRFFRSAHNEKDSAIGFQLQNDKASSNHLLKLAGYPATDQRVCKSLQDVHRFVEQQDFPIVIKPMAQDKGLGITANIRSEKDLQRAFQDAYQYSPRGVLVEKFVKGDDYRISVSQGKFIGALRRNPAQVLGDGINSIEQLIAIENERRKSITENKDWIVDIIVDSALIELIQEEGLNLQSIPEKGRLVKLRANANVSTGGSYDDVANEIHPDNIQLAYDIAALFRLNTIGLDFITTDIKKSYLETGTVIEINALPGLFELPSQVHLKNFFPDQKSARIPTTLILSDAVDKLEDLLSDISKGQQQQAWVTESTCSFNGQNRDVSHKSMHQRALAFLAEPQCQSLVMLCSMNTVLEQGLALDYFDTIFMQKNVPIKDLSSIEANNYKIEDIKAWLTKNCGELIELSNN